MAYATKDKSVQQGQPVEFYKFTGDFGTYRYTSDIVSGVCNGELYVPVEGGISHSDIELTVVTDSIVTTDIELPASNPLARAIAFGVTPDIWQVEIRRAHYGDDWNTEWSLEWQGFGQSSRAENGLAILSTGNLIQQFFGKTMPNVRYVRSCNHKLYDARCKVNKANWTLEAEVSKIQGSLITVVNDFAGNNELNGGQVINSRTGERRPILTNVDNVIRVPYKFVDLVIGDELQLIFGCNKRRNGDCRQRFNNVKNYGGFDWIPVNDPFADMTFLTIKTIDTRNQEYIDFSQGVINVNTGGGGSITYIDDGTTAFNHKGLYHSNPVLDRNTVVKTNRSSTHRVVSGTPTSVKGRAPSSDLGGVVPYVYGRRRIAGANIIQYSAAQPVYEKQTETKTKLTIDPNYPPPYAPRYIEIIETTTIEVPIGFTTSILCAICLGPDVKLRAIYSEDIMIWSGNLARGNFNIGYFGTALDGVEGYFTDGAFDQPIAPINVTPAPPIVREGVITTAAATHPNGVPDTRGFNNGSVIDIDEFGPYVPPGFGALAPATLAGLKFLAMFDEINTARAAIEGNTIAPNPVIFVTIDGGAQIPLRAIKYDAVRNYTWYMAAPGIKFNFSGAGVYTVAINLDSEGIMPAYQGIAYVALKGVRGDIGIGKLSFEVERYSQPFGASQNMSDRDINVASALYDVITNEWGGMGISTAFIGASFAASKATFAAMLGYCSVLVESQTVGGTVIEMLQQQVDSKVYASQKTGKLEIMTTPRSGANIGGMLNISYHNIQNLNEFTKQGWGDAVSQVEIAFSNRANNYEVATIVATGTQNASDLQVKEPLEMGLSYVCRQDIAAAIAARIMTQYYVPKFSGTVIINREGANLVPGEVSLLNYPEFELWSERVSIDRIRKSNLLENTVAVSFTQYIQPDEALVYIQYPDDPSDVNWEFKPLAPTSAVVQTAPYFMASRAGLVNTDVTTDSVFPMFLPVLASGLQMGFNAYMLYGSTTPQSIITNSMYPMHGTLDNPIAKSDGWTTGTLPDIEFSGVLNVKTMPDLAANFKKGVFTAIIDSEMFVFSGLVDLGSDRYRLTGVRRAMVDTVAAPHAAGADVFIVANDYGNISRIGFPVPLAHIPTWKFVSRSVAGSGKIDNPTTTLTVAGYVPKASRSIAPPRPHDAKIDGVRQVAAINLGLLQNYDISWKIRTRIAAELAFQTDANHIAEGYTLDNVTTVFQKHRVYLRDSANVLHTLGTTLDDANNIDTLTVTIPAGVALGAGTLFVRSVLRTWESVFDDEIPVVVFGQQLASTYVLEA